MTRPLSFEYCPSNLAGRKIEERDLPQSEIVIRKIWASLPLAQAQYFTLLDAYTLEDDFFIALGDKADRLYEVGIERVGDLIAMRPEEVARRGALSGGEIHRLNKVLSWMGLRLSSDVSLWRDYRRRVASDFRLRAPYQTKLPQETLRAFDT